MSGKFLKSLLTAVDFPSPVVPLVVESYKDRFAEDLAYNASLGDRLADLARYKLPVDAAAALVRQGNVPALEAVLATREHRDTVMHTILGYWKLSADHQVLLADRSLSVGVAFRLMSADFVTPAKAAAARRTSVSSHIEWLNSVALSDDEMFTHLVHLAKKDALPLTTLVPILLARPMLRPRALRSGKDGLVAAACWTELSLPDQILAADTVLSPDFSAYYDDPATGLLSQPSLDPGLRYRLWEKSVRQSNLASVLSAGVRQVGSPLHVGCPLAQVDDYDVLNALIDAFALVPANHQARAVGSGVLFELSKNPHLDMEHACRIAFALCQYDAESLAMRVGTLHEALARVAERIDQQNPPSEVLRNYGICPASKLMLERVAPTDAPATAVSHVTSAPPKRWGYALPAKESVETTMNRTVTSMSYGHEARLHELSPHFTKALGYATTEVSIRSWMNFLGLVEDDPAVPLSTVLDTAKRLASAPAAK